MFRFLLLPFTFLLLLCLRLPSFSEAVSSGARIGNNQTRFCIASSVVCVALAACCCKYFLFRLIYRHRNNRAVFGSFARLQLHIPLRAVPILRLRRAQFHIDTSVLRLAPNPARLADAVRAADVSLAHPHRIIGSLEFLRMVYHYIQQAHSPNVITISKSTRRK